MRVGIDYVIVELFAYVVPAAVLPADILIGQSFTELRNVRAYKTDTELTLYQTTCNQTNSVVIRLKNDCEIKGNTVIWVNSLSNYTGCVSIISEVSREKDRAYFIML